MPVFSLFPGVGTFLVFSYCASHITSSCGNSSESRLDLFWDLSPVASCRDQSEDCLPPPGPSHDGFCLSSLGITYDLFLPGPARMSLEMQMLCCFCSCIEKLYHWVWFNCRYSTVDKFIQGIAGKKSLGTFTFPKEKT